MTAMREIPAAGRVVVAMSGGVDSSVAAALLQESGADVVGVTLRLYDDGGQKAGDGREKGRACCAGRDIEDARAAAARLGIAHHVLDYAARFREAVIEPFAAAYAAGETPIPCVLCNQTVKFHDLLGAARLMGAEALATGHYARRIIGPDGPELHRAADGERDQSYFLFATTRAQLDLLRFPLGALTKAEVRAIARRRGLSNADKRDSQDICFVPDGDYARLVRRLRPDAVAPGEIVDRDGRVLGRHDGIAGFTIGQRRGLGLGGRCADGSPLFVLDLDAKRRRVVVGPREALATRRVTLREPNWLAGRPPADASEVRVKLRSAQADAPAWIAEAGQALELAAAQSGVAPGQAAVIYAGQRVLGGGWIARA